MAVGSWLAELDRERSELDLDGCSPGRLTSLALPATSMAEALHLLVTQSGDRLGRRPPPMATITDLATASNGPRDHSVVETWGGQPLAGDLIARLACDADLFNNGP